MGIKRFWSLIFLFKRAFILEMCLSWTGDTRVGDGRLITICLFMDIPLTWRGDELGLIIAFGQLIWIGHVMCAWMRVAYLVRYHALNVFQLPSWLLTGFPVLSDRGIMTISLRYGYMSLLIWKWFLICESIRCLHRVSPALTQWVVRRM